MRKITVLVPFFCIIALLSAGCQPFFTLFADDTKFISASVNYNGTYNSADSGGDLTFTNSEIAPTTVAPETTSDTALTREIEEADLVKLIDRQLYILNQDRGLRIVDVSDWSKPSIRGGFQFHGYPIEMYVNDQVATIVATNNSLCRLDPLGEPVKQAWTVVYTVDVSNASAPQKLGEFEIDGYVNETRRVGDVIYLAGQKTRPYYSYGTDASFEAVNDGFVTSILVADPTKVQLVDEKTIPGLGEYIHATQNAIFVAGMNWDDYTSKIQYVDISDPDGAIVVRGQFSVPGRVLNRFAMDAHENIFRVVANKESWWTVADEAGSQKQGVRLYTFDLSNPDSIQPRGELFIIQGETLHAVRFDGLKGYLVTYERRDPLWVLDLSDPNAPAITGYLEAPGYSTFLEVDGNQLVAVGIDDQQGWRASVMLYDVSDAKNPRELDRKVLGTGYSSSVATYDDKAFKVITEADLILVPYDMWDENGYKNRLTMLQYSPEKLTELATVDHSGQVLRSNVDLVSDVLWILSQKTLQTMDIKERTNPQTLAELPMAEYVLGWKVIGDYGLRLVTKNEDWENPTLELQVLAADQPNGDQILSSKTVAMSFYDAKISVVDNSLAILTGLTKDGVAKLLTIDLTTLPTLTVASEKEFEFLPDSYSSSYGYYGPMYKSMGYQDVVNLLSSVNYVRSMPLWQTNQNNPMILSNRGLVYICTPEDGNVMSGSKHLQVVSIADPDDPKVVSQSDVVEGQFDMVLQIGSSGTTVFNTVGELTVESLIRILGGNYNKLNAMYSIRLIDLTDLSNPQSQEPINIPGVAIGMNGQTVYTMDPQWSGEEIATQFCTVGINNGRASLISSVDLPAGEPGQIRFTSDAAIVPINKFSWYGYYPMPEIMNFKRVAKDDECNMGSTRLVSINLANPKNLQIASDTTFAGLNSIAGVSGPYVIGQVSSSSQGLLLKIGEDKALSIQKVVDMPYLVTDITAGKGTIDVSCGPRGVVVVNP